MIPKRSCELLTSLFLFSLIIACQTAPISGRSQLNLMPASVMNSLSLTAYDDFLTKHKVCDNNNQKQMVSRVGRNIRRAVEKYFAENNMSDRIKDYAWNFSLVMDPAINAWCLPNGRVVVYTGILPVAKDEQGLAVIIGHEVAHAVANHGNERVSQMLLANIGTVALSQVTKDKSQETQDTFMNAYGIGTQVGVLLPYSRLQEEEADHLGLIFMAMAGYEPHAAVSFWQRMSNLNKQSSTPPFLSTHPTNEARISNIRSLMPEAMKYYK